MGDNESEAVSGFCQTGGDAKRLVLAAAQDQNLSVGQCIPYWVSEEHIKVQDHGQPSSHHFPHKSPRSDFVGPEHGTPPPPWPRVPMCPNDVNVGGMLRDAFLQAF